MAAGYSGTPLAKKLGIEDGFYVLTVNAPDDYRNLLEPLPDAVEISDATRSGVDLIHLFTNSRDELFGELAECVSLIKQDGSIWVSWYKKPPNCRPRSPRTRFARPPFR